MGKVNLNEIWNSIRNRLFKNNPPQSTSSYQANPTPTPTPEPINITIPGNNGEDYRLPNRVNNPANKLTAEDLFEVFEPYKLATESAQVLKHPYQQTYSSEEIQRLGKNNYNYGENPDFGTGKGKDEEATMKAPNDDGSFDYGTMRINDQSFNEMLNRSDYWKNAGAKRGINSLEDIKTDTRKNIEAALLMLLDSNYDTYQKEMEKQGTSYPDLSGKVNWNRWYAAPQELRFR